MVGTGAKGVTASCPQA